MSHEPNHRGPYGQQPYGQPRQNSYEQPPPDAPYPPADPYGDPEPYGDRQPYGGSQPHGGGQPNGGAQPYGGGAQPYGDPQPYGGSQPYGGTQPNGGAQPYGGGAQPYGGGAQPNGGAQPYNSGVQPNGGAQHYGGAQAYAGAQPHAEPQPQGAPPPAYPGRPQAPKSRPKWPWILGGILLVAALGCAGVFAFVVWGADNVVTGLDDNANGRNAATGKMNVPIKDGTFEFTVSGMQCGLDHVGDGEGKPAQGQFCLIDISVKNVGKKAEIFSDISQTAYDNSGDQYSADSTAGVYANQQQSTFLQQINPGDTVRGKLVFDVPVSASLKSIVLHETMFSTGVRIPLA
ncbi:DUF4352 domain-containing protein [Paractinoplanes globisporus]|uniref:DUF4352 domain-containing protein n=1 Tax=Paractinoplanes globisporus TaxID=113565 RepID=A0ABW6WZG9_9ACTN|nr:DUF4352 domain-containing protein [Actinoplanes globisporus]